MKTIINQTLRSTLGLLFLLTSIAATAQTTAFEITEQFPTDRDGRVVQTASFFVSFSKPVASESFDANSAIIVRVRDTGELVAGEARLSSPSTIEFTPANRLTRSVFSLTVASNIVSTEGDVFAGQSLLFATLPDLGTTTQETVSQCGAGLANVRHIFFVSRVRSGEIPSCTNLGFAPVAPVALSCELSDAALSAARAKASTLNVNTGGFNPVFNYDQAVASEGVENVNVISASGFGANTIDSLPGFYNRQLSRGQCAAIMNPDITEIGALLATINGRFGNVFGFFEFVATSPR